MQNEVKKKMMEFLPKVWKEMFKWEHNYTPKILVHENPIYCFAFILCCVVFFFEDFWFISIFFNF